ncbi:peroxisomal sarcosine oxidase isoform X2 [Octopus vulgaris]|uniref:Peroxisomal sarcosine oxidase isoform X2 n=1 Tax=Octopus vulgaris TaxID=6645 RepID=A0AA36FJ26_OCTVU|nr:peroxisomal sarcosine oxidase isoform X2 [Octopus vulgaris]
MMKEAYPMWAQLERDSDTQLYKKSQLLVISTPQSSYMDEVKRVLIKMKMTFKDVPADHLLKEFCIKVPAGSKALIEPEGGILLADRALMTFQDQFKKLGGKIIDGTPVLSVEPGEIVKLHTTKGIFQSRNVVLCQGSWAKMFFNQLGITFPLKPMKISVAYFKSKVPGKYELKNNFPAFYYGNGVDEFYGLPAEEYPGMLKMTPDEQFVLDRHPKFPNLILGAGFSGHGFKLAPVTGKILGDMVMNKRPSYDMSHFRLDRFSRKSLL